MTDIHPAAPHHLPVYIASADGSDPLFTGVVCFLLVMFLLAGVLYFKLHSLPEHMGEKANSTQLQLISILAILALFTHNNTFWVLALLIAAIRIPDYLTPIQTIANSLAKLAKDEEKPHGQRPISAQATETVIIDTPEFSEPTGDVSDELPGNSQSDKERI